MAGARWESPPLRCHFRPDLIASSRTSARDVGQEECTGEEHLSALPGSVCRRYNVHLVGAYPTSVPGFAERRRRRIGKCST
eukprot:3940302-Rhodomonas_salina.4